MTDAESLLMQMLDTEEPKTTISKKKKRKPRQQQQQHQQEIDPNLPTDQLLELTKKMVEADKSQNAVDDSNEPSKEVAKKSFVKKRARGTMGDVDMDVEPVGSSSSPVITPIIPSPLLVPKIEPIKNEMEDIDDEVVQHLPAQIHTHQSSPVPTQATPVKLVIDWQDVEQKQSRLPSIYTANCCFPTGETMLFLSRTNNVESLKPLLQEAGTVQQRGGIQKVEMSMKCYGPGTCYSWVLHDPELIANCPLYNVSKGAQYEALRSVVPNLYSVCFTYNELLEIGLKEDQVEALTNYGRSYLLEKEQRSVVWCCFARDQKAAADEIALSVVCLFETLQNYPRGINILVLQKILQDNPVFGETIRQKILQLPTNRFLAHWE